jgi:aspartate carbamoyltransferase catalytic subunit
MFTMREHFGRLEGLKVSIIGDIFHSRVARSNLWGLTKMGANVTLCGPQTLMPTAIEQMGATVTANLEHALRDADVVMGLRIQKERLEGAFLSTLREYHRYFGVNEDSIRLCEKDVLIMHPGPVNRGVELSSAIVDADNSVINEQVTSGVAVRMALLYLLTRKDDQR